MKKSEAIKEFGIPAELARLLKISPQAVNQWGDTVPELQEYKLKEIRKERALEKAKKKSEWWYIKNMLKKYRIF